MFSAVASMDIGDFFNLGKPCRWRGSGCWLRRSALSRVHTMMGEEEYLSQRLEDQINYYDRQSQKNQRYYKRTKVIEIVSASLIPFLAGNMDNIPHVHWLIGILGLLIAVCEAFASLHKYQENWLQYRAIAEALGTEKFLFMTKTKPYADSRAFRRFVLRIEGMLAEENNQWMESMQQENQQATADNPPAVHKEAA